MADNVLILVHRQKPIKPKKTKDTITWYDPFYKSLLTFEGVGLKFIIKKEEYIETDNGPLSINDAIKIVREYNVKNRKWISDYQSKKIIDNNCNILTKYRLYPEAVVGKTNKAVVLDLNKWFSTYKNYNNSSVYIKEDFEDNIIFEGKRKDIQNFCDSLNDDRLVYEII